MFHNGRLLIGDDLPLCSPELPGLLCDYVRHSNSRCSHYGRLGCARHSLSQHMVPGTAANLNSRDSPDAAERMLYPSSTFLFYRLQTSEALSTQALTAGRSCEYFAELSGQL